MMGAVTEHHWLIIIGYPLPEMYHVVILGPRKGWATWFRWEEENSTLSCHFQKQSHVLCGYNSVPRDWVGHARGSHESIWELSGNISTQKPPPLSKTEAFSCSGMSINNTLIWSDPPIIREIIMFTHTHTCAQTHITDLSEKEGCLLSKLRVKGEKHLLLLLRI